MTPDAPAAAPADARWRPAGEPAGGVRWIIGFAASVAAVIALSPPLGYFLLSHQAEKRESAIAARLHAAFLTQVVLQSGSTWQRDIQGLIDTDLAPGQLPERRTVLDNAGRLVAESGGPLLPPLISSRTTLLGTEGPVGEVMVERSTRPLVHVALMLALGSFSLAAATFAALVLFPLRALRETIAAVRREASQARARVQAEENLRVVFEHSVEGILMFDAQGIIVSSNPAAQRLLGGVAQRPLDGQPVQQWFEPAQGSVEFDAQGADGRPLSLEVTVTGTQVGEQAQWVAILRDITERRQHERRLWELANLDTLTGLPNRAMFRTLLPAALSHADATGEALALMFLDLDRFKHVNDTLGHDAGDALLRQVAARLSHQVRGEDPGMPQGVDTADGVVFRLAGDEFTILLRRLTGPAAARDLARRVLDALAQPVAIGEVQLPISTSIGIALYPAEGGGAALDADGLVKRADLAMYRAKTEGRNRFCVYGQSVSGASDVLSASDTQTLPARPDAAADA